ncbi:hypothetical protein Tco_0513302 [Tanacetum coccineum]
MEKLAERAYAIERGLWTTDAVSSQTFMIEEILQWQKYYHKDEDYVGEFIDGDTAGRGCVVERESRESMSFILLSMRTHLDDEERLTDRHLICTTRTEDEAARSRSCN